MLRIDQCDARAVGARNRLGRELRHVPEKIDHPFGAGHNSGHSAEPRIQFGLVCFPLARGEFGRWRRFATGLGVEVGQHPLLPCTRDERSNFTLVASRKSQSTSANAFARRSFPDGVLGIIPGLSTTTLRGRTSTSATTSWAT